MKDLAINLLGALALICLGAALVAYVTWKPLPWIWDWDPFFRFMALPVLAWLSVLVSQIRRVGI